MGGLEDYLKEDGFVDVLRILGDGKEREREAFPGLLPFHGILRKEEFGILDRNGRVYLDTTATSQVPQSVKDLIHNYRSNTIRGSNHSKNSAEAREAQEQYELAKDKLVDFFGAGNYVLAFTSGTTDASNWIGTRFPFKEGDLFLYTEGEHNSQIVTARNFAKDKGAKVGFVKIDGEGRLDLEHLEKIVDEHKNGKILLNLVHASNVTGVINPVKEVREILGSRGFIYLDIAQSAGHVPIYLDALDVDFVGVSAHKMYGPTGIGAMFVNNKSKRCLETKISGGSAVELVSRHFTNYSGYPERFEPGTPDIEGAIEWRYTIDFLERLGMDKIAAHDEELGKYFVEELEKIKDIRIYGPKDFENRTAVVTFNLGHVLKKSYDHVAQELDRKGISVRDGCFCSHILGGKLVGYSLGHEARALAMNLGFSKGMMKLPGAVRASFSFYNNLMDAYKTVEEIREIAR
ncbi:aminotransferase class V-fold PLP-dependent enzyme [Candidatus Woesearchaeota archaeon]|jgi:cysteine desulfurase / selenocysteine lyase|nr:aminotransferase class V-fold PLP-dependent enzyme [Candidatus Woesearchaeota archaeon]